MSLVEEYFLSLSAKQSQQYSLLPQLYTEWNNKINIVSRKDIENLMLKHVLHSLSIAKVQPFLAGAKILDIGTGGGFPGIPLAIMFPETEFILADSIAKKIKVVNEVKNELKLNNVTALNVRAETIKHQFDFIISRAVTEFPVFCSWTKGKFLKQSKHNLSNGILYLKGGDLKEEMANYYNTSLMFNVSDFFKDPFFETKKVIHLSAQFIR
ncbi:MAG: 16S rRNA (guanine(527)-N(7))-methyltransferase RsmG [Bacteroidetes bacterium]|nr:16S rRNA (guanine(527)-N(7))-methyltransferase RsmG [Bacteroidota bacterium]